MTWKEVVCMAVVFAWLAFCGYAELRSEHEQRAKVRASCAVLFRMAHNSSDSLYVAMNRGECAK
jgi:hypothetical protein